MEATSAVTGAGLCNITDQAIREFWQNRDFAKIGLGIADNPVFRQPREPLVRFADFERSRFAADAFACG
jgi:hypothetical protein